MLNPLSIFTARQKDRAQRELRRAHMSRFQCITCGEVVYYHQLKDGDFNIYEDTGKELKVHGCQDTGWEI